MLHPQETAYYFSCQSISLLQARSLQVVNFPGFIWAGSSSQTPLCKGGSWGKKCGMSFTLAGLYLVHWDILTALTTPMGDGTSHGDSTYWSNSFPSHIPVHKRVHGQICSCDGRTSLLLVWAADTLALEEPSLGAEGGAGPGWEHQGFSWAGIRAPARACKGPPRHIGLPPALLFSSLCSQGPCLGWYNIQDLTM